jgi:uncharacterized protein
MSSTPRPPSCARAPRLTPRAIVQKTAAYVRSALAADASGHDAWHAWRVWRTAVRIAQRTKGADAFVVQLAALLHDIADWKLHGGDASIGPARARAWLARFPLDRRTVDRVCAIIRDVSFKGAAVRQPALSIEGRIVQDADRLDAIGAVGVARAFAYGGWHGRAIHDPRVPPVPHRTAAAYLRRRGATINHFYEKLLLLNNRMHTPYARRLAAGRHVFLLRFLEQFRREWEGHA